MRTFLLWLKGLLAAFIWKKTLTVAVVGGIFAAASYLAKSPLPAIPTTTENKS